MDEILTNYINSQLNEVPSNLNKYLSSFKGIKYNKRSDFTILKKRMDHYLNKTSEERFFVLPGLRGVGKTTLLLQCYEYLLKEKDISPTDMLYISCDDLKKIGENDLKKVIETYLKNIHNTTPAFLDKPVFIFVDEAHYDKQWALNAKILFDKSKYIFMMITGSSSLHLDFDPDAARRLKLHEILPLNYSEHLKLKYDYDTKIREALIKLLFEGNVVDAQKEEFKIQNDLINLLEYNPNEWNTYFNYGGFCSILDKIFIEDMKSELWSIISKIISEDIAPEFELNQETENIVYRVLVLIASQKPGEISQNKVAGNLSRSTSTINKIFKILEQTKILFHYQAYGGSESQSRKSWKYYITTSSLKNGINKKFGHSIKNQNDYEGILLENMVASSLFNLRNAISYSHDIHFDLFYDQSNGGVDFVLQREFEQPVPIEVGLGNKKDKQVKKFMKKNNSPYAIIISNKTDKIVKKNDIIYVPPKTFSFI